MACAFPSTVASVDEWLDIVNLARYKEHFSKAGVHLVSQLRTLTDEQLKAAGVQIAGHRRRLLNACEHISEPARTSPRPEMAVDETTQPDTMEVEVTASVDDALTDEAPRDRSLNFAMPVDRGPAGSSDGQPQRKYNSTSSIYATSTLTRPDTKELIFGMAVVVHDRIQQGEECDWDTRHRFPFFSEENNPLYAQPAPVPDLNAKRTRHEVPSEDMIFHTIRSVFECSQMPPECLIICLVYIERLLGRQECPMLVTSWRPILLAALIIAHKVSNDRPLHNRDFAVFCPMFTLREISFLEMKLLQLIDYDVTVAASLYATYYFQLRSLCERVDCTGEDQPMDAEAAAKLEVRALTQQAKYRSEHGVERKYQSAHAIEVAPLSSRSKAFLIS